MTPHPSSRLGLGVGGETFDVDEVAKAKADAEHAEASRIQYGESGPVRIGTADRGDTGVRR